MRALELKLNWTIAFCTLIFAPSAFSQSGGVDHPIQVAMADSTAAASTPKVYKYTVGGVTSFSDIPPRKRAYVVWTPSCYACNPASTIDWESTKLHLQE